MKRPTLGRGKNISIPKAALIWFFERWKDGGTFQNAPSYWDWGEYGAAHEIVDIAGANHASFFTSALVSAALSKSDYWDKRFVPDMYSGMRGGQREANLYSPSVKGREWFKTFLSEESPSPILRLIFALLAFYAVVLRNHQGKMKYVIGTLSS